MENTRLKEARIAAGFRSARKAAMAMAVPVSTYTQHENGTRDLSLRTYDDYVEYFEACKGRRCDGEA